ncbi:MAG: radical SAM protein [Elusimicrobia bacterium]|nr:radical SAM protein [Elusimicrobiota bacterium]
MHGEDLLSAPGAAGERAELRISKVCRRRCVFCCEARSLRSGGGFMPLAEACSIMKKLRSGGAGHLTLLGGEPTVHPQFGRILRIAKLLGYSVQVTTDGTGLADPAAAARLLPDIDELCLSVHWNEEGLARAVTRMPSAFSTVEKVFSNVERFGKLKLFMCHTVVCSLNSGRTADIAKYVFSRGRPGVYMMSQLIPWGNVRSSYGSLTVRLPDFARAVRSAAGTIRANGARLVVSGAPFCALGPLAPFSNDLLFSPRLVLERGRSYLKENVLSVKKSVVPPLKRTRTERCSGCALADRCAGVFGAYLDRFGDGELRPIPAAAAARILRARPAAGEAVGHV